MIQSFDSSNQRQHGSDASAIKIVFSVENKFDNVSLQDNVFIVLTNESDCERIVRMINKRKSEAEHTC